MKKNEEKPQTARNQKPPKNAKCPCGLVVSASVPGARDPGSIPGGGTFPFPHITLSFLSPPQPTRPPDYSKNTKKKTRKKNTKKKHEKKTREKNTKKKHEKKTQKKTGTHKQRK